MLAGNPKKMETSPCVFGMAPGRTEYAFVPLVHRIDIDRLYGLMLSCPDRSNVKAHGSFGDRYKQNTWEHMSPFEMKAMFDPAASMKCWETDLATNLQSKQGPMP